MKLSYDEISPFTKNMSVLVEDIPELGDKMKMCMDTGYQTYATLFKAGSQVIKDLALNPATMETAILDDNGNYWFKYMSIDERGRYALIPTVQPEGGQLWEIRKLKVVNGDMYAFELTTTGSDGLKPRKFDFSLEDVKVFSGDDYRTASLEFDKLTKED